MSTSYTGTLKLGKPAAGDTGWGNTLNGEVTDMVEEAISGMSTINTWSAATPAVHTLTEANGSTSESRAAILRLTDTTSDIASVANLIVPDNTKLYCIINETGHTVTVKTASGSGIAVPTAVQTNVVCNGTNVVEQTAFSNSFLAATLTADTLKITADGTAITGFVDEDDMASNSAVKVASQQSIKAYVDNNGLFPYVEKIIPWSLSSSITTGAQFTITSQSFTAVAEFTVPGNADTQYHSIDIAPYLFVKLDTGDGLTTTSVKYVLQKKVKVNTGTTLGTVVTRGQKGGTGSHFFFFTVAGDKRQDLGQAAKVGINNTAGSATGKYEIESFTYDAANNRTEIAFDNGASSISSSIFAVDSTAYIATDGWASVGSYIDVAESFLASKAMNSGSSIYTPVTYEIPSLPRFMVKNSNSAATEFKFSIAATGNNMEITYQKTYVTSQNIRRG